MVGTSTQSSIIKSYAYGVIWAVGVLCAQLSYADYGDWELRDLYRGSREMAMGGAYVGLADDEQAMWLNPAGIAGQDHPSFQYADITIDGSADLYSSYLTATSALSSFTPSSLNKLMGQNPYGRAQVTSSYLSRYWGVGIIVDTQGALYEKNLALPQITLGYQITEGVQAAVGVNLLDLGLGNSKRPRKTRRPTVKPELRIGVAGKALFRRGGYKIIPTSSLFQLSRGASLITDIFGNYAFGIGFDVGTQFVMPVTNKVTASLGAAYLDVGDTKFQATPPNPIVGNFSVGGSLKYNTGNNLTFIFAYDYRNIFNDVDWRLRNHFGLEVDFVNVALWVGINQVYLTYGVGFNAWIFRINALSYADDLGPLANQDANRRYMLRVDLKLGN